MQILEEKKQKYASFIEDSQQKETAKEVLEYMLQFTQQAEKYIAVGVSVGAAAEYTAQKMEKQGKNHRIAVLAIGRLLEFWQYASQLQRWHKVRLLTNSSYLEQYSAVQNSRFVSEREVELEGQI